MPKLFTLLIILTIVPASAYTQTTAKDLFRVFKKSIRQESKKRVDVGSNAWVICNSDSAYYRLDTLVLHSSPNSQYSSQCCDYIEWTFYRRRSFYLGKTKVCQEPPISIVDKENRWFELRAAKVGQQEIIELSSGGTVVDKFKLLSIAKAAEGIGASKSTIVTLVRTQ